MTAKGSGSRKTSRFDNPSAATTVYAPIEQTKPFHLGTRTCDPDLPGPGESVSNGDLIELSIRFRCRLTLTVEMASGWALAVDKTSGQEGNVFGKGRGGRWILCATVVESNSQEATTTRNHSHASICIIIRARDSPDSRLRRGVQAPWPVARLGAAN